jgi:hypothetical protein
LNILDFVHIPIIALVQLVFSYYWSKKIRYRLVYTRKICLISAIGAFLNVWGLDVILHVFEVSNLKNAFIVSAGCWLVFVVGNSAKYYEIYGWSKKDFWLDYGGDFLGIVLSGLLIYLAT